MGHSANLECSSWAKCLGALASGGPVGAHVGSGWCWLGRVSSGPVGTGISHRPKHRHLGPIAIFVIEQGLQNSVGVTLVSNQSCSLFAFVSAAGFFCQLLPELTGADYLLVPRIWWDGTSR